MVHKQLVLVLMMMAGVLTACSSAIEPGPDTFPALNEEYRQATKLFYDNARPAKKSTTAEEFAAILDQMTYSLRQHSLRIEELRVQHKLAKDRSNWPQDLLYADRQLKRGSENFLLWSSPVIKEYFPNPVVQRAARDFGMVMKYFEPETREPRMDF